MIISLIISMLSIVFIIYIYIYIYILSFMRWHTAKRKILFVLDRFFRFISIYEHIHIYIYPFYPSISFINLVYFCFDTITILITLTITIIIIIIFNRLWYTYIHSSIMKSLRFFGNILLQQQVSSLICSCLVFTLVN